MGTPDNIFANLEQDTQDPTVLSNVINDTFLEPMLNYPPLTDNVAVISENDTPIVVSVEEVLSHLQRIGSGKSSGPDNLPNWVLKIVCRSTCRTCYCDIECVFPGGTATRGVEASKRTSHSQK